MPLNKTAFKNGFVSLMSDMRVREEISDSEYAERFANLLEAFVNSGDGVYQTGTLQAGPYVVTANYPIIVKTE